MEGKPRNAKLQSLQKHNFDIRLRVKILHGFNHHVCHGSHHGNGKGRWNTSQKVSTCQMPLLHTSCVYGTNELRWRYYGPSLTLKLASCCTESFVRQLGRRWFASLLVQGGRFTKSTQARLQVCQLVCNIKCPT